MADQITSTDRKIVYSVRFSPGGEEYLVEAANAVTAQQKGIGLAALEDVNWTGIDTELATENQITDFYGDTEEE